MINDDKKYQLSIILLDKAEFLLDFIEEIKDEIKKDLEIKLPPSQKIIIFESRKFSEKKPLNIKF